MLSVKKRTDEFLYKPFAFEIAYFEVEGQRGGEGSQAKIGDFVKNYRKIEKMTRLQTSFSRKLLRVELRY